MGWKVKKQWIEGKDGSGSNFVGQNGEVLLGESNHIAHFENGAVSLVDWVKATRFYVLVSDVEQDITPEE